MQEKKVNVPDSMNFSLLSYWLLHLSPVCWLVPRAQSYYFSSTIVVVYIFPSRYQDLFSPVFGNNNNNNNTSCRFLSSLGRRHAKAKRLKQSSTGASQCHLLPFLLEEGIKWFFISSFVLSKVLFSSFLHALFRSWQFVFVSSGVVSADATTLNDEEEFDCNHRF